MGGLIGFWVLCGVVGGFMGTAKPKIGGVGGIFIGLLLGPLGLLIIIVAKGHPDPTMLQKIQRRPDDPAPGWHPDPLGRFDARWWNGTEWTYEVGRINPDGTRSTLEDPI